MVTKPRPQTQREFLSKLITPNTGVSNSVFSEPFKPGEPEFNRALEISLQDDINKVYNIGIEDIDEAILFYFKNIINPSVLQNNNKIQVPIIYGNPEQWKGVQQDGYYRDQKGKIQTPVLLFNRDSLQPNRTLGNKLDGNAAKNVTFIKNNYSRRNNYDNFYALTGQILQEDYVVSVIPDYVTLTYSCILFTEYIEQADLIIESINFAAGSYWGDPKKFQFKTRIDSYITQVTLKENEDRTVKYSFNLVLNGYIIPDSVNKEIAVAYNKFHNFTKVIFNIEAPTTNYSSYLAPLPLNTTDPDAQAFILAASITNSTQQTAITNLVTGLKANTLWSKMKAVYPFVGGTAFAHKWNLKDPRDLDLAFRLTFSGVFTHDSNGITGNGVDTYAETYHIPSSAYSFGIYSRTNKVWSGVDIGVDSSNHIYIRYTDGFTYYRTGIFPDTAAIGVSTGLFVVNNTAASGSGYYNGGLVLGPAAGTQPPTTPLKIGGAVVGTPTDRNYAFAFAADNMTSGEHTIMYSLIQAFETTLGRQV
jgi:hypothetical protein